MTDEERDDEVAAQSAGAPSAEQPTTEPALPEPPGLPDRAGRVRSFGRFALRVAWFLAASAIALGSAGLTTSLDHQPGTAARPELTWAGDRAIKPAMEATRDDLLAIERDLERLGELGRAALVSIVSRDTATLAILIEEGTGLTAEIERASRSVRATIAQLPGTGAGEELRLNGDVRERRTALQEAAAMTGGLAEAWSRLEGGAVSATRLTLLLEDHDQAVVAATAEGRRQRYRPAVRHLQRADVVMAEATTLRNTLANTVDVATLDEWLRRNTTYDKALRRLYTALRGSAGRVTREVREAFADERAARGQLPPNTRGLVIIMNDIAQGGVNDAVVGIERARGRLQDALDGLAET